MTNESNFDFNDEQYHIASIKPGDTKKELDKILLLCEKKYHIGFGLLDSFLSGPDIENRKKFIENEIKKNPWLRDELLDTIPLNGIELSNKKPTDEELIEALKKIL